MGSLWKFTKAKTDCPQPKFGELPMVPSKPMDAAFVTLQALLLFGLL